MVKVVFRSLEGDSPTRQTYDERNRSRTSEQGKNCLNCLQAGCLEKDAEVAESQRRHIEAR